MFSGKQKAITFSYDDGVTQDIRLLEILNKYGLKGTFNLCSNGLGTRDCCVYNGRTIERPKVNANDVKYVYAGHEVAGHTLNHPVLKDLSKNQVIREVEDDRLALSDLVGYEVVGMAYPGGTNCINRETVETVRNETGIKYARTTTSTFNFDLQDDLIVFNPTVYTFKDWDEMIALGEKFVALEADKPQLFYIWGHAYEFDFDDSWDKFDEFCRTISGKSDIFYGTNKDVLLAK